MQCNAMKELKSGRLLVKKIATKLELRKAEKTGMLYVFKKAQVRKPRKTSDKFC